MAITRLWTVAGLTRKWDSHNSGKSHSTHHAHRSPLRKFLEDDQFQDVEENPGDPPSPKNSGNVAERKRGLDHYRKRREDKNQGREQAQDRADQEDYPTVPLVSPSSSSYLSTSPLAMC